MCKMLHIVESLWARSFVSLAVEHVDRLVGTSLSVLCVVVPVVCPYPQWDMALCGVWHRHISLSSLVYLQPQHSRLPRWFNTTQKYLNSHFQFVWMLLFKSFKDAALWRSGDPTKKMWDISQSSLHKLSIPSSVRGGIVVVVEKVEKEA